MHAHTNSQARFRRTLRFAIVACSALLFAIFGAVFADASSLGGVSSANLTAVKQISSSGAPTVTAWENFTGANGTNINGTTTDGGSKTWVAVRGTWRIRGNQADVNNGDVALVVNAGTPHQAVEATVFRGGTTFDVGVVFNMNASGTDFITTELTSNSSGQLEMWRYNGSWTLLATASNLYSGPASGWPTSANLRASSVGGNIAVYLDGALQISHTLSAADQTTFVNANHQYFGLYSYFDGASRWDDFHIDS